MELNPSGVMIEIVGLGQRNNGRSCDVHGVCGVTAKENMVVRISKVQVLDWNNNPEDALAVHSVINGVDTCRIGFLPRYCVKHWKKYHGAVAQITEVYTELSFSSTKRKKFHHNCGCCEAVIISLNESNNP